MNEEENLLDNIPFAEGPYVTLFAMYINIKGAADVTYGELSPIIVTDVLMFSKSFLSADLLSLNLITSITGVDINVERGKVESRAVDSADRWDEHACLAAVT